MLLLLLWAGVLAFLLVDRQVRRRPQREAPEFESVRVGSTDRAVSVRRGFVYSDTTGVEPNFRIAARETVEFASGWYELRDVEVWLYSEGRVAYGLIAGQARYNPRDHQALAEGDAHVSLRGGGVVRSDGFSFSGADQLLASRGAVTVAGPGWSALAERATFHASDDRMVLDGRVSLSWRSESSEGAPVVLLAPFLEYRQKNSLITFPQGVSVLRERLMLRAAGGEVQLIGGSARVRNARLSGPVSAEGYMADGSVVHIETGDVEALSLQDGRFRVTTWAHPSPGWVRATLGMADGSWHELSSWRLTGEGRQDRWEWLEAQGQTCLVEIPPSGPTRLLHATTLRSDFRDGQPFSVVGSGGVEVRAADQWAKGEELKYSLVTRRFVLQPRPGGRVTMGAADVEASADLAEGTEGGEMSARGKVTGFGRGQVLQGTPDDPVHFAADVVGAAAGSPEVVLSGDARVWQGSRLLRADRLALDRSREVVKGSGGVLTTAVTGENGGASAVRVRSRLLEYDRGSGRAVYEGDVVLEDVRGTARAQRMVAHLDPAGQLRTAELEGGVSFVETSTARKVTGQRATLDALAEVLDVWGQPVLVQEPTGNQVKASHLRWRRDTATLVVLGADGEPTETIYRPEPTVVPGGSATTRRNP